jgi:adenosylcobinamide kinase / adenosylcobinamide-phosphate guanylyltransferase
VLKKDTKRITLVLGGARSGKSSFAQSLAMGASSVGYLATAQPLDDEMRLKIQRHRQDRPSHWRTIEEPVALDRALSESNGLELLLVDCLTLYSSNLLMTVENVADRQAHVDRFCHALEAVDMSVILVSNEVGSGVVPPYPMGREYRDFLGELNQRIAAIADNVILMVAGLPLPLKGKLERCI